MEAVTYSDYKQPVFRAHLAISSSESHKIHEIMRAKMTDADNKKEQLQGRVRNMKGIAGVYIRETAGVLEKARQMVK
ncbi:MAG: hypothetical protein J6O71_00370 [Lachnospiraceae bacterium]|nr:hypothetical protein [Lachnospiraceae bacterium]